jgi:hypothetical protein
MAKEIHQVSRLSTKATDSEESKSTLPAPESTSGTASADTTPESTLGAASADATPESTSGTASADATPKSTPKPTFTPKEKKWAIGMLTTEPQYKQNLLSDYKREIERQSD